MGDTGRPTGDDGGGGTELAGARLGGDTSRRFEVARSRMCRCSCVSGMLCSVISEWQHSAEVGRQNTRSLSVLEPRMFGAEVAASGRRIRSPELKYLQARNDN